MRMRWRRSIGALSVILVLMVFAGIAYVRPPKSQPVEVVFLGYTNSAAGGLSATIEIRNRSRERIARNSCRISPEPADVGYWYAADIPSHRLEPGETERLVVSFQPGPMTRWRATIIYVRNPTTLELRLMECVDWLRGQGWAPTALREWLDGLNRGQASTDWIEVPVTNSAPNPDAGPNDEQRGQSHVPIGASFDEKGPTNVLYES